MKKKRKEYQQKLNKEKERSYYIPFLFEHKTKLLISQILIGDQLRFYWFWFVDFWIDPLPNTKSCWSTGCVKLFPASDQSRSSTRAVLYERRDQDLKHQIFDALDFPLLLLVPFSSQFVGREEINFKN